MSCMGGLRCVAAAPHTNQPTPLLRPTVNDTLDAIFDDSDAEEETDSIMSQVLDEIGIDLKGQVRVVRVFVLCVCVSRTPRTHPRLTLASPDGQCAEDGHEAGSRCRGRRGRHHPPHGGVCFVCVFFSLVCSPAISFLITQPLTKHRR